MQELRDAGYLPAAVRNYLALLGWGTQDDTTIMSTDELIERFDLERVGRSSAIFDEQKLRWLNGRFMREMDLDDYTEVVARHVGREPDERLRAACEIAQEKAQTLDEVWPLIGFLFEEPEIDEKAWKKVMKDGALPLLSEALEALRGADSFDPPELETALGRILAEREVKPAKLYQPIRVAITGTSVSPGIFGHSRRWGGSARWSGLNEPSKDFPLRAKHSLTRCRLEEHAGTGYLKLNLIPGCAWRAARGVVEFSPPPSTRPRVSPLCWRDAISPSSRSTAGPRRTRSPQWSRPMSASLAPSCGLPVSAGRRTDPQRR